jgi:hypothetical protein
MTSSQLQEKDQTVREQYQTLREKDKTLQEQDQKLQEKNQVRLEKDRQLKGQTWNIQVPRMCCSMKLHWERK